MTASMAKLKVESNKKGDILDHEISSLLTEDSMKVSLKDIASKNTEKFISAGFPPKICTLLIE